MDETPTQRDAPAGADGHYFGQLTAGIFEIRCCTACGRHHFFPRVLCPHCGSDALEWVQPSGLGTVYSTTIVRRPEGDYTVTLVDLKEGPRVMSTVVDTPVQDVCIGLEVRARIDITPEGPLLVFVPGGPD